MFDEYYYKELREDIRRAIALAEKQNSQNTSVLGGNSLMPQQIAQPSLSTKYAQNGNIANDADIRFRKFQNRIFQEEGQGYNMVDQPTHTGIIQSTLDNFRKAHPEESDNYPVNIRDLNFEQINNIYRKDFFDKYNIDRIRNDDLAFVLYDTLVNHSPASPSRWIQQGINENSTNNITVDGVIGSQTINAANALTEEENQNVINYFLDKRFDDFTQQSPNYQQEFRGVFNRINRLRNR